MGEILTGILIDLGIDLLESAAEYCIRWVEDEFGNKVVEFFYQEDTDGDGVLDDVIITSIHALIPDLSESYNFVSDGDTVGIGYPAYQVIDGCEISNYLDTWDSGDLPVLTGSSGGYIYDGDVFVPLNDMNGDSVIEWGLVLDDDNNGVPDVADGTPYYPVGSDGFNAVVYADSTEQGIMEKPLDSYTVTEGLLLCILLATAFYFVKSLFRKKDIYR